MKAEKPQGWPRASWRHGTSRGGLPSPRRPEDQGSRWRESWSTWEAESRGAASEGRRRWGLQRRQRQREEILSPPPFSSTGRDWTVPAHPLLSPLTQTLVIQQHWPGPTPCVSGYLGDPSLVQWTQKRSPRTRPGAHSCRHPWASAWSRTFLASHSSYSTSFLLCSVSPSWWHRASYLKLHSSHPAPSISLILGHFFPIKYHFWNALGPSLYYDRCLSPHRRLQQSR